MRTQSLLITICLAALAGNPAAGEEVSCKAPPAIQFAPGATAGSQTGGIARGELACWTLSATQGQRVELKVRSPESNVVLQFYRPGWAFRKEDGDMVVAGQAYPGAAEGDDAQHWSGRLSASGKQLVVLGTTRGSGEYRLDVSITK